MPNRGPMREVQVSGVRAQWSPGIDHPRVVGFRADAKGLATLGPDRTAVVFLTYGELASLLEVIPASLLRVEEFAQIMRGADVLRRLEEAGNA